MEKLTLEHLAPYLPYGLKFYWEELDGTKKKPWTLTINSIGFALDNQNKPILRPLSDLTKEIEHKGERFVPKHILRKISGAFEPDEDLKNTFDIDIYNGSVMGFRALC